MSSVRDQATNGKAAHKDAAEPAGLTLALADRLLACRFDALPGHIVEKAKHCVLDYVACALAGADDKAAQLVFEQALEEGAGPCSVIARSARLGALQAALVNGTAAHALDYDDCILVLPGHLTVAVLPALWALAELRQSSGAAMLTAFVAAFELGARVARLVTPAHYERGFHATATIGAIAAAGGCAHLLGLSNQQTASAIGIATTQAAGLKAMFGTMCKPLHAGRAAQNGLLAAQLARRGFESRNDSLECAQGFAAAMSPTSDLAAAMASPPHGFYLADNLFKFHASCYGTQGAINAARALRARHCINPSQVVNVTVRVGGANASICNIDAPRTGNEAKFSIKQMAAWALEGVDTSSLRSFSDDRLGDEKASLLRDKIQVIFDPAFSIAQAEMTVSTRSGEIFGGEHDAGLPITDMAEENRQLEAKARALIHPKLGEGRSSELVACLGGIDKYSSINHLANLWTLA
jgi:2-methylcitrate dehydratase PrpD